MSTCLQAEDTGELIRMLAAAELPSADVELPGRTFFRFEDEGGLLGYGGWEGRGSDRLLRSLLIVPERQRQGLGGAALAALEARAQDAGAERLHLLTTTAASFFHRHGYRDAARIDAPKSIGSSMEFKVLCPASANYMVKALGSA